MVFCQFTEKNDSIIVATSVYYTSRESSGMAKEETLVNLKYPVIVNSMIKGQEYTCSQQITLLYYLSAVYVISPS